MKIKIDWATLLPTLVEALRPWMAAICLVGGLGLAMIGMNARNTVLRVVLVVVGVGLMVASFPAIHYFGQPGPELQVP